MFARGTNHSACAAGHKTWASALLRALSLALAISLIQVKY